MHYIYTCGNISYGGLLPKNRRKIVLNSQKLTVNRETVIKITAVVAIAALMFSLILVFNGMIGYAADDYLYFSSTLDMLSKARRNA